MRICPGDPVERLETIMKETCPCCGENEGVPLVWGSPSKEQWEAFQRNELVLAGCMIQPYSGGEPDYACLKCSYRWTSQDG